MKKKYFVAFIILVFLNAGCSTSPPAQPNNICSIFEEKDDWYDAALVTRDKWGVPVHIPMAIIYQESAFIDDAQPPMQYFLGFVPTGRASTAYGYPQAKNMTWNDYVRETGNGWGSRDDFEDALDFIGWYINKTHKINGVSKWDAYHQYLNYHEGWGGYKNKSYKKKKWLMKVAKKVDKRAKSYSSQYSRCKSDLDAKDWFFF